MQILKTEQLEKEMTVHQMAVNRNDESIIVYASSAGFGVNIQGKWVLKDFDANEFAGEEWEIVQKPHLEELIEIDLFTPEQAMELLSFSVRDKTDGTSGREIVCSCGGVCEVPATLYGMVGAFCKACDKALVFLPHMIPLGEIITDELKKYKTEDKRFCAVSDASWFKASKKSDGGDWSKVFRTVSDKIEQEKEIHA